MIKELVKIVTPHVMNVKDLVKVSAPSVNLQKLCTKMNVFLNVQLVPFQELLKIHQLAISATAPAKSVL